MYNIEEIKEQFSKVIQYSQGIKEPKLDKLFNTWYEAKKNFIKAFGGNLWYEYPQVVSFPLSKKEQHSRVQGFLNFIEDNCSNYDLSDFIHLNMDGFFKNEVIELPHTFSNEYYKEHPEENVYKDIKLGMKLFRTFKYFESDSEIVTILQNEASRIVQESKVEGILRISVHPLDFLSASETTYNWRSCHSLDGEYRAGNLSYMSDSSTVMVYLCSEDKKKLPRFPDEVPWWSKKWRMLLHYSDNWDMMFAGRQYPFFSKNMLDFVRSDVLPKTLLYDASESSSFVGIWSKWTNKTIEMIEDIDVDEDLELVEKYIPINGKLFGIRDIMKDGQNSKQYNDILYSTCYKPYYSKRRFIDHWSGNAYDNIFLPQLQFNIGKEVYCLECENDLILGYGQMGCPHCTEEEAYLADRNNYVKCIICKNIINKDDMYYVNHDHDAICYRCRDRYAYYCQRCDGYFTSDYMGFNLKRNKCYCVSCNEDIGYIFDDEEE